MKKLQVAAGLAALIGLFVLMAVTERGTPDVPLPAVDLVAARSAVAADTVELPAKSHARTAPSSDPLVSSAIDPEPSRTLKGVVVEAGTGLPLAATLRLGAAGTVTNVRTGRFHLTSPIGAPSLLTVQAAGHVTEELHIDPEEAALGRIELAPTGTISIHVVDREGRGVPRAACELRAADSTIMLDRGHSEPLAVPPTALGETHLDGHLEVRIGARGLLWVTAPDGRVGCSVVGPGVDVSIQLLGPPRCARFTDQATGAPIVGRSFAIQFAARGGLVPLLATTDDNGEIPLPCGPCALTLKKSEPRLLLAAMDAAGAPGCEFSVRPLISTAQLAADAAVLNVQCRNAERMVFLVDEATGGPVDGRAWLQHLLRRDEPGSWRSHFASSVRRARDGQLALDEWFSASDKETARHRWLAVAGYAPLLLDHSEDLEGTTLRLSPSPAKRVRVLWEDGSPYRGRLTVASSRGPAFAALAGLDGWIEALPWGPGTGWVVSAESFGDVAVSAAELSASDDVEVRADVTTGALAVRGAPPGHPPVLLMPRSGQRTPLEPSDLVLRADEIPVGHYAVGTSRWLDGCLRLSGGGFGQQKLCPEDTVEVIAGEVTWLDWNDAWWHQGRVQGRVVEAPYDFDTLAVLPICGHPKARLSTGPLTPWQPVAADGTWALHADGARPVAIAFARLEFEGRMGIRARVLDVVTLRSDGLYAIPSTSVELYTQATTTSWAPETCRISPVTSGGTTTSGTVIGSIPSWIWTTSEPLRLNGLPATVTQLRLRARGLAEPLEFRVATGSHVQYAVEWPQSPEPDSSPDSVDRQK